MAREPLLSFEILFDDHDREFFFIAVSLFHCWGLRVREKNDTWYTGLKSTIPGAVWCLVFLTSTIEFYCKLYLALHVRVCTVTRTRTNRTFNMGINSCEHVHLSVNFLCRWLQVKNYTLNLLSYFCTSSSHASYCNNISCSEVTDENTLCALHWSLVLC